MEKVSLASVKIVSVSWAFIVNADMFKLIAMRWNSLGITWLKQSVSILPLLLCRILSSKLSTKRLVQVFHISEPPNPSLSILNSLIHLHRNFSFICLQKLQNKSIILAWCNNQLSAIQCSFRFSKGMEFPQRKNSEFCTGKRCTKIPCDSCRPHRNPPVAMSWISESQTLTLRFKVVNLKKWSCFEILLFVKFVIQYYVIRKAQYRSI